MDKYFELSNGVRIPAIGYGTYRASEGAEAVDAVITAISDGYRHIDTAAAYKNEHSVGEAIATSGIEREAMFVTTKVWNTERGYDKTMRAFDNSLKALDMDYIDLYLVHWPASASRYDNWQEINSSTWKALEQMYHEGRVRAIGVSNFMPHHLEALLADAEVCPMVNQIEYHPGFMQQDCVDYCQSHGILVEAWSPLGRGRVFDNELLMSLAERHNKSVPQICLRWELQHGVLPLPKSVNPVRIKANIDVFDFELTDEEMLMIDRMGETGASGLHPDTIDF